MNKPQQHPEEKLELTITVEITKVRHIGDGHYTPSHMEHLNINEKLLLRTGDFTEICRILGQFHDLTKQIQAERGEQPI